MRVLFVTRKFPPSMGGMEAAARDLYESLTQITDVELLSWSGSRRWLPFGYVSLAARTFLFGLIQKPDVVYLQDGLLAPIGWVVKHLTSIPTVITVHGLELTYDHPLYRRVVPPLIAKQTRVVAVSRETRKAARKILGRDDVDVVRNGVRDEFFDESLTRADLVLALESEKGLSLPSLEDGKVVHLMGRLIPRKGFRWFVENVVPALVESTKDVVCLVSGDGPEADKIRSAIQEKGLHQQVYLLGHVSDDLRRLLYNCADVLAMPNLPVEGDMEGFGLVVLEAASCGTPVVASDLEGIRDAVADGENGYLVPAGEATSFVTCIAGIMRDSKLTRNHVREFTLAEYSWTDAADAYTAIFHAVGGSGDLG